MEIEFDSLKAGINLLRHGVRLEDVLDMDFATALIAKDTRRDYGEARHQGLGLIAGRLHMLVFTMRGTTLRVISLRKANERERRRYDRYRQSGVE